jgi:hypothetical protein
MNRTVLSLATVLLGLVASGVQAQTAGAPAAPPPGGGGSAGGGGVALAAVAVAAFVLIVVLAKVIDLRRKREDKAIELQTQISEALVGELRILSVTPTVHLPAWGSAPATIELSGQVPNPQARRTALRIVTEAASRVRPDFEIQDRMAETPAEATRSA